MRRRHRILVAAGLLAPACSPAPIAHRGRDHVSAIPLADAGPDATVAGATTSTGPAPTSPEGTTGSTAPAPSLGPVPTVPSGATTVTFTLPTAPRTTTTLVLPEDEAEETDEEWWAAQPGYGPWSIPAYIVGCESGGSWTAENPSGAAGPYQLMPEHFGGESALEQSREAQHAKAAELWDGGKGKGHWEACL